MSLESRDQRKDGNRGCRGHQGHAVGIGGTGTPKGRAETVVQEDCQVVTVSYNHEAASEERRLARSTGPIGPS